jgi:hypothetical protein
MISTYDYPKFSYIKEITAWDSGGGNELDIVELSDGRVLAISDEAVVLYDEINDLLQGQAKKRETIFL